MILFAISFILVFFTAYLITSILAKGNYLKGFIYINLVAFGQIVVIAEILSTFYKIHPLPFLILNFIFAITASLIWLKSGKPILKPNLKPFFKKFYNAYKLDHSLFVLGICWLFFIFTAILLIVLMPVTSGDAQAYHVLRSVDWIINQSLAHYETADIRCISFPINSEILYMWILLFTKKQLCLGIFSFVGYLIFLVSTYGIFKHIGYSLRRTFWTLLIVSSFASVIAMASSTETDLIVAGLLTASVYLFISAVKNKSDNINLFMSSLAYALAIGVKTPAIIAIPAIGSLYIIISFKFKDKFSLLKFLGFGIINFIIFSSYNYILNFIDFGNFMNSTGEIFVHKNHLGIKGLLATFLKHLFLLVDFSGINVPLNFDQTLFNLENSILKLLNLNLVPSGIHSGNYFSNTTLIEPNIGCGILSFLLILPCWIISLILPIFKKHHFVKIQGLFALIFLINLLVLSSVIVFMTYNTRFITAYILISAPMLVFSYIKSNKNLIKLIYILVAIFSFIYISTHLWTRPLLKISKLISIINLKNYRSVANCVIYEKRFIDRIDTEWCSINELIEKNFNSKNNKILYLPNQGDKILSTKMKKLLGYKYDFVNMEHIKNIDIDKYDIVIISYNGQLFTYFDKYTPEKIDYYYKQITEEKSEYRPLDKNTEVACYYADSVNVIRKELGNENSIPVTRVCNFTNNFYENHPFKIAYRTKEYYILLNKNKFSEYKNKN